MNDRHTATAGDTVGTALYSALRAVALGSPDAPAVIGYDGAASTYGRLLEATDAAAAHLTGPAAPGCRILGVAVDDPFTFLAVYFAAAKLDLVAVLLDSRFTPDEKVRRAAKFDLDALVVEAPAGGGAFEIEPIPPRDGQDSARNGYQPDDFVIHCTSGSTGEPKGIVLSQSAIMARVRSWSREIALGPDDVVLCALPLWHCHGIDILTLPALLSGSTIVYARAARLTGRGLARMIKAHEVSVVSGLPVMYQMLAATSGVEPAALASLRVAITGSAPIAADTQAVFRERFGLPLRQVYGLSEIGALTHDAACMGAGTIGKPLLDTEFRLAPVEVFADGEQLSELYVRGPSLARGYYRDAAAESEMFVDGWLRTHDLIEVRPEGWYVRGRMSTFINVAGSKVAPLEVEAAVRECDGVLDCAVVGVSDGANGEQIAALIVVDSAVELDHVRRQASSRLLPYQLPQLYRVTAAVPRTPIGKIDYDAVRRAFQTEELAL
ncbi:class I adenylate-forming enzyme family protein [Nocardia sp. NPDC059764]|uniref:class I adenylate-forming enzyme family protein n=1 Tax=Nocardia sp. NPDC059764 TaxID=3346939 RepID=UPI00366765E4